VVVRARLIHGWAEGRVGVGSQRVLMRCLVEGLVVGDILGRVEMIFCRTKTVEVRVAVDRRGVLRHDLVVGA
jgi:hypothetical protein